ncbi:acyltransferase [Xylanimonas allomyrinae]|uniref:Acyltransferase n=1 Tax=Xylanimonas allomyrinae TaxID=2509459 RepID=A0A4V0YE86_9MICO|nr:acyltransferase [Xylanimonas allomyrinae]QAY63341.1 acyltransferase [Xylanimonas allomyrinae]
MAVTLTPPVLGAVVQPRPAPDVVRPRPAPDVVQPRPAPGAAGRRDRFVDGVRALATLGIVAVHWLMPEATWDGQTLGIGNALGHGSAWTITWVLQVLPLLFFAAGASAAYQHTRLPGIGWGRVLGARLRCVARPVGAFAVAWAAAVGALLVSGVPDGAVWRLATMAPQLLWFLGVWVVLVALTPALLRAWRRWRWGALGVAVAAPLLVDLLRFGAGIDALGWANVILVWAVPFLAGAAYADAGTGRARRTAPAPARRLALGATAVLAFAALCALVVLGPYPPSLIGMPGDAISNLAPPTAPVVAQSVMQVAVVLLAREAITRWATGRGRRVVDTLARRAMTVYLWHLTAMFAVVAGVMLGLHERLPEPWSTDWWSTRPVWFGAFALALWGLVRVFGRFESRRGRSLRA